MGFEVKEIQATPNPNAAKFILNREISDFPLSFLQPADGKDHPVASRLFSIKGVSSVLILGDFVTVNKLPEVPWKEITQKIKEILQNYER